MKNFYYVLFFLIVITPRVAAQNTVERYNELMNRYEYFNSSNNMIGYKTYNKLRAQWEYYSLEQQTQQQEYTYNQPYNTNLINQALSQKQKNWSYNVQQIKNTIDNAFRKFDDYEEAVEMKNELRVVLKKLESQNYDYSSNDITRKVINHINASARYILNED